MTNIIEIKQMIQNVFIYYMINNIELEDNVKH